MYTDLVVAWLHFNDFSWVLMWRRWLVLGRTGRRAGAGCHRRFRFVSSTLASHKHIANFSWCGRHTVRTLGIVFERNHFFTWFRLHMMVNLLLLLLNRYHNCAGRPIMR